MACDRGHGDADHDGDGVLDLGEHVREHSLDRKIRHEQRPQSRLVQ